MWLRSDHRGVQVLVRGEFVAPREWLIRATVSSGSGSGTALDSASWRRMLRELWKGIVSEGRVGRRLGAVEVRVVFDGDLDIMSAFAASAHLQEASAPRA